MNLAELRDAVRTRCGFNDRDSMHTPASLNAAINEANWDLADEQDWPWATATETLTTTAGTAEVAVASNWLATIALHSTDNVIFRLDPIGIDEIDLYADSQGRPQVFAEFGGQLVLGPTPDAAYSLRHRYRKAEPELTADDDTPLSPVSMHRLIVERAASLAYLREGNVVEARLAEENYRNQLQRARKRLNRSGGPVLPRVRPGAGWG